MNRILSYIVSAALLFTMISCSKSGSGEEGTIKQNVTMDAEASSILVTIERLNEPIVSVRSGDNWLMASFIPYTSGGAMVKLEAKSNPDTKERKTMVYIQAESGMKVELTVVQSGKTPEPPEGTTIEDSHNRVTDQPAYVPRR